MDIKDIIITALFAVVVLLTGFFLGQRKIRKSGQHESDIPGSQSSQMVSSSEGAAHPAKRLKDYSKQLASVRNYHQRASAVYAALAENTCYTSFNDPYVNVDKANAKFNREKNEHTRDELLAYISEMLETVTFGNLQSQLMKAAEDIGNKIIEYYEEQVEYIFARQPFESLVSRYRLNSDLRATQAAKMTSIISANFAKVILDAHDIEQNRAWLKTNYSLFVEATSDKFDWGATAKNFGMGALAVVHPLIGIPAFISNFTQQSARDKSNADLVDNFGNRFDELEGKIHALRQEIIDAVEKTKRYVGEKFTEVNNDAIMAILTEVSSNGYAIDHYFSTLDLAQLKRAEREFDLKGA